jgi:hypothetical protein
MKYTTSKSNSEVDILPLVAHRSKKGVSLVGAKEQIAGTCTAPFFGSEGVLLNQKRASNLQTGENENHQESAASRG